MIDLAQYKRAIQWLLRGIVENESSPEDKAVRYSLLHSFEVTYNLSENVLRQILTEDAIGIDANQLSSRELMRYASEDGLQLCTSVEWMEYGLALERTRESLGENFAEYALPVLPKFANDLQHFAEQLQTRLVQHA